MGHWPSRKVRDAGEQDAECPSSPRRAGGCVPGFAVHPRHPRRQGVGVIPGTDRSQPRSGRSPVAYRDTKRATGRTASGAERYFELRLEELLSSPEEQMRRMCAFLGEDFDQSLLHFHTTARGRIPPSDLRIHPRLGEPPRPVPPSRDGAASGLVRRAAAALINAELVELGYVRAASSGRLRRIVYVVIGYTIFLASLWRNLPDLFRHFTHSVGASRAARSVTASPSADRSKESPCPNEQPGPLLPRQRRSHD